MPIAPVIVTTKQSVVPKTGAIGITGSSKPITDAQLNSLYEVLTILRDWYEWQNNGDCIAADALAGTIWKNLGGKIWLRPPINNRKRAYLFYDETDEPLPYLERNHNIVDNSEVLVAIPSTRDEVLRSGTWATIRHARKKGIPIIYIFPSGDIVDDMDVLNLKKGGLYA